ncbi:MAG: PD40 domain-containing protein [Aridibacter famidurans]|nr:PD40 domain-containing protein [Aridibacter famidurans]
MKRIAGILFIVIAAVLSAQAQNPRPYLTEPALSPDGAEIAFVSGGDIWTVPSAGGTARILVSHPATEGRPAYSPDGKKLAFYSERTGDGDIYILDLATNRLDRVTFNDTGDFLDGWSKDGEWLYFYSSNQEIAGMNDIFRVRASGGTPLAVSNDRYTNEFFSAPSPDGASVAFSARGISNSQWWRNGTSHIDESELWLKTGAAYTKLTERGAKQQWPMWAPDGQRLYYVSDRGGAQNIWTLEIGGRERRITDFRDGRVLWANISNDGGRIAFERDFEIWSLDLGTGKAARVPIVLRGNSADVLASTMILSSRIDEFSLSPDGKKIAFIARGDVFAASSSDGGEAVQVTKTAAPESFAVWSPDSRKVIYASEREGTYRLYEYDFGSGAERRLTSAGNDYAPAFAPDGKSLAFLRNGRSIMRLELDSLKEWKIADTYSDMPPLAGKRSMVFSKDGKWLAYLTLSPNQRSYTNVWVAPTEGGDAKQVSFLANSFSGTVSWSPDGRYILFDTVQRTETPSLARVDLELRTPKFDEDKFRGLFEQENPREKPKPSDSPSPSPTPVPEASPSPSPEDKKDDSVVIAFEEIRKRLSLIQTGVNINEHAISPDGKTLLVTASAEGKFNLYTIAIDELERDRSPKQITSTPNFKSDAQFSPDGKQVYYIENGRINSVTLANGAVKPVGISAASKVRFEDDKIEIFEQGWRYMRDHFYDPGYHGVNWNSMRTRYRPLAEAASNIDELRRIMSLMVGELNASHLGVSGSSGFNAAPIGRLGLRFDREEFENNGRLKITEVIALGPAAVSKEISVGDLVVSVDGSAVGGATNLNELLENKVGKRVELGIQPGAAGAETKTVVLKPVSTGAEKSLLYDQWVESNRDYVARVSGGRLGYAHLPNMSSNALESLYVNLDVENQARDGVVIDIRNNNGGFVNPYVIDVLSRQGYLTMQERGLWPVPARSSLGQRALELPTILVTNQHSLSDAEDLTEGYRALKLGKVVGEPTSGWIIFTWSPALFDGTRFRLPRTKITGVDGKNMELNPRPVDVPVTRPVGETFTGSDSQLDAAVRELLKQLGGR